MLALVSEATGSVITATLELQVADGAPRGALSSPQGRRIGFTGWTELAYAIEDWRDDAAQTDWENT